MMCIIAINKKCSYQFIVQDQISFYRSKTLSIFQGFRPRTQNSIFLCIGLHQCELDDRVPMSVTVEQPLASCDRIIRITVICKPVPIISKALTDVSVKRGKLLLYSSEV
ncbi:hypothetical protein QTP88_017901 [Uroleucon formosanum]